MLIARAETRWKIHYRKRRRRWGLFEVAASEKDSSAEKLVPVVARTTSKSPKCPKQTIYSGTEACANYENCVIPGALRLRHFVRSKRMFPFPQCP